MYLSLYCKGSKRVTQGWRVRGSWRPNINCNILTPTLMAVNVVSFAFSRCSAGGPEAILCDGFLYCILSATSLGPNSSEPQGPFGLMWLSLQHFVYNSVRSPTATVLASVLIELYNSSRPLSRLLDLWNRMFDRHQAEITVMQFTGHSLPVHQSMSVPWEFFFTSSHFISQFPPTRFPLITAIRMCHLLPAHHLGMAFLVGSKAKIQQYH